jgi:hypothetical protein
VDSDATEFPAAHARELPPRTLIVQSAEKQRLQTCVGNRLSGSEHEVANLATGTLEDAVWIGQGSTVLKAYLDSVGLREESAKEACTCLMVTETAPTGIDLFYSVRNNRPDELTQLICKIAHISWKPRE